MGKLPQILPLSGHQFTHFPFLSGHQYRTVVRFELLAQNPYLRGAVSETVNIVALYEVPGPCRFPGGNTTGSNHKNKSGKLHC